MVPKDQKVAVVTGSSTGIGFETCLLFARSGIRTYATMRDLSKVVLIKKAWNETVDPSGARPKSSSPALAQVGCLAKSHLKQKEGYY